MKNESCLEYLHCICIDPCLWISETCDMNCVCVTVALVPSACSTHMQDLQEVTHEIHYENYRSDKLADGSGGKRIR